MELIDKSALVKGIEKIIPDEPYPRTSETLYGAEKYGKREMCFKILDLINTLEVKEVDLEKDVRQILSLYHEGLKHYEDIIKEEREENGGSDLVIKILDGVVDARELAVQYVIDKLKVQKGE